MRQVAVLRASFLARVAGVGHHPHVAMEGDSSLPVGVRSLMVLQRIITGRESGPSFATAPGMHSATELKFSTRQRGDLPAWVSNLAPRQPLRIWALADAKSVSLRLGSESVLVRVRERSSLFVGEISGFEPSAGVEFQGMRVGDLIIFNQAHIFGAGP